jgi:lysozyme
MDAQNMEKAKAVIRYRTNRPLETAVCLAAALCRRFEGAYLRPYTCSAGVATLGYGATFYPTGVKVQLTDDPITLAQAESILSWMLRKHFMPQVITLCPGIKTPEQLAAITDFAFNLGIGRLKSSTLRKRINEGDWEAVPDELRKWTRGGGKVLRGLVKRREAEILLIESAK